MFYVHVYVRLSMEVASLKCVKAMHSAPEQWPSEKKTSTPKINVFDSVLLLYIDI